MMLIVNIDALISALNSAEPYANPEMSAGTEYLFNTVYKRLAKDEDIYLKELDLSLFSLDDVSSLATIYNEKIERNSVSSRALNDVLIRIEPVCAAVSFV